MAKEVLHEGIFMEMKGHVGHYDVICEGEQSAGGVVSEFSGPESIESSDPTEEATLLGKFFVDEGGEGSEGDEPGPLYEVHCWNKYYSQIKPYLITRSKSRTPFLYRTGSHY